MGCVQSKKGSVNISSGGSGRGHGGGAAARAPGQPGRRDDYYTGHPGIRASTAKPVAAPAPMPKPEDAVTEEEKQVLKVINVDFRPEDNAKNHHTDRYEATQDREEGGVKQPQQLVVRRGKPFDIDLTFDRPFAETDDIKLVLTTGANPLESRGTMVQMMLSDEDVPRKWGAKKVSASGNHITLRLFTPPSCCVAKWDFKFDSVCKKDKTAKVFRYSHPNPIYMLFNPWCPDDQVYLDDEASRDEYILNDHGRIFRGTATQISGKPWNFGQFEDFMLDCCMHLLDQSELSYRVRGDPVKVARKISAIVNSSDDNGVLTGNWSGDYSGGTSPLYWCGSVRILEQYWKTLKPVSFGQCWVFSGVVTTVCRALGIPARSVTNFASAHDSDASVTIDYYVTENGEPMDELNGDSVWNFHVWNDVWMARPDLPPGFGGWQAIDATPQETSEGVYCAGPCSLEAIKNGLTNLPYDSPFIFAEVNADKVVWVQKPDGNWRTIKKTHVIGKNISSKGPNSTDRLDVTRSYKFPEGSQQEKTAVWRAVQEGTGCLPDKIYTPEIQDMKFDLIDKESVMYGQPFSVAMRVTNEAKDERVVKVTFTAKIVYYTGVPAGTIKSETYSIRCPQGVAGLVEMKVSVDEYLDKVVDMCNIKMSVMAQVEETEQFYCDSDDLRLLKPDLTVKAPGEVKVGEEYDLEVSFTNPLPRALTKCEFTLEGASLQKPLVIKQASVGPHAEAKMTTKLKAKKAGLREIIAGFDSKEISDLSGTASVKVVA